MVANFNKAQGLGRLVVDRYMFQDHITGANFRHQANQIDIAGISGVTATDVQGALSQLSIINQATGQFVTIGDGYDVYATGAYNAAVPALDGAFSVLTNIADPKYQRVRDAGILVIKAGTYKISTTINIPPGIMIMGESYGTKLINATNTTNATGGVVDGGHPAVAKPMFRIKADLFRQATPTVVGSAANNDPFLNLRETRFYNLLISDNNLGPKSFGDTTYQASINRLVPLIYLEQGAAFKCENVLFLGRASTGQISTYRAIDMDPVAISAISTFLTVRDCFFDGFANVIGYNVLNGTLDNFNFKNNSCRVFGGANADTATASNNCFFNINACNASISNNYLWADNTNVVTVTYVTDGPPTIPFTNAEARINISGNNISVNKGANISAPAMKELVYNPAKAFLPTTITSQVYGNNVDNGDWTVKINGSTAPLLTVASAAVTIGSAWSFTNLASGSNTAITVDTSMLSTTVTQADRATNSGVGAAFTIQAQNATGTASTGGALVLQSGNGASINGTVQVKAGANIIAQFPDLSITGGAPAMYIGQTTPIATNYTILGTASQTTLNAPTGGITSLSIGGSALLYLFGTSLSLQIPNINWTLGITAPTLKQADNVTVSATGQPLSIQAQNATGAGAIGGDLVLQSGTGTTNAGAVSLKVGATEVNNYQAFQGTVNTQIAKIRNYTGVVRTTVSGAITILTIPLATTGTIGSINVYVNGRDVSAGTVGDGCTRSQLVQYKNVAGVVTASAISATTLQAHDTSLAGATLNFLVSGTNALIQVNSNLSITMDWTATAYVLIT